MRLAEGELDGVRSGGGNRFHYFVHVLDAFQEAALIEKAVVHGDIEAAIGFGVEEASETIGFHRRVGRIPNKKGAVVKQQGGGATSRCASPLLGSLLSLCACMGAMNPPLTPPRRGTFAGRTIVCSPPGRGRGWVSKFKVQSSKFKVRCWTAGRGQPALPSLRLRSGIAARCDAGGICMRSGIPKGLGDSCKAIQRGATAAKADH